MDPSLDPDVVNLAKATRDVESGNDPTAQGQSGEYGAYQYTPATWAKQSAAAGVNVPLQSATPEQQNEVWYKWAKAQKDAGYNIGQIASMQNAGEGNPDAYLKGNSGTNSYGVQYDTAAYAKKVVEKYQQYKQQSGSNTSTGGLPNAPTPPPPSTSDQASTSDAAPQQGFLQEAGNDIGSAVGGVGNAVSQTASGQINPLSGLIQGAGAIAGGVGSVINDAATNLPVVGGVIKGVEGLLGQGVQAAANTAPGKAVVGAAQGFSQAHPELAGDIGAAGNIAGLAGTLYGGGALASAGKEAVEGAIAKGTFGDAVAGLADKKATSEALDIASSPETKATLKAGIKSGKGTVSGVMGTANIPATADDLAAANAIKPLVKSGAVGSEKTAVENASAVKDEIGKEAQSTTDQLDARDVKPIANSEDLANLKTDLQAKLADSLTLTGNSAMYGDKILNKFFSLLPQDGSDITSKEILQARQGLDAWARGQRGSKIFDPTTANAQSEALRIVRQGANKLAIEKAPTVTIKESLARQSALYDALDNIAAKGTKEVGTTRFGRFAKRHPIASGLVKGALRYGAEGLGVGAGLHVFGE